MTNICHCETPSLCYKHSEVTMDGQTLKSGAKKDEGKNRLDLVPFDAVEEIGKVLTFGSKKYEDRNWELGIGYGRVFGAAMRHLTTWFMSKVTGVSSTDPETGLSHLAHAGCCVLFLLSYELRSMTEFDDRPSR
jgi:hypothetical protein